MKLIWLILLSALAFSASSTAGPQQQDAASNPATILVRDLSSEDWTVRAKAVDALGRSPDLLKEGEVKSALIQTLEREDQIGDKGLRNPGGAGAQYGEGYAEYVGRLSDVIFKYYPDDKAALLAQVRGIYNPDSRASSMMADHASVVLPAVLAMAQSDQEVYRTQAMGVLGFVLRKWAPGAVHPAFEAPSPVMLKRARQTLVRGLKDPSADVRSQAIEELGKMGGPSVIPALQKIAQSDPAFVVPDVQKKERDYWVRKEAAKAIISIRQRGNR